MSLRKWLVRGPFGRLVRDDAHGVSLLTGRHDVAVIGPGRKDAVPKDGRDIVIGESAWVSSNATIIVPCRIGKQAVVAAGAVVTSDVPDYAVVAGVPARLVRTLDKL